MNKSNKSVSSANRGNGYNAWNVNPSGNVNNNNSTNSLTGAPDFNANLKNQVVDSIKICDLKGDLFLAAMRNNTFVMPQSDKKEELYTQETIFNFKNLSISLQKCLKNVSWKDSAAHISLNEIVEILKLKNEIKKREYRERVPFVFVITSPKKRTVLCIVFRDRVYQRTFNDLILYPKMTRSFIYDNMACQKNKGPDIARNRLKLFIRQMFIKHNLDFYVLQIDIHKYYPSMVHELVYQNFSEYLTQEELKIATDILDFQYSGDVGFNPGSQMVQIAGISFLSKLDHYIKENLKIKRYIRYQDDFVIIHESKGYLEYCKLEIEKELNRLKLTFNLKKTKIYSIKNGIPFLGFNFNLTHDGKVLMFLNPSKIKSERRRLKKQVNILSKKSVYNCYKSWRNHALKGNCTKMIIKMDKYFKDLMEAKYG